MRAEKGIEQRGQKWNEPKAQMGEVAEVFANSAVFFGPFLDHKATEDSFRTEREYNNTAQLSNFDAADKQTETARLGPKGEAKHWVD